MPEAEQAMALLIENERVPPPTVVHRIRNANPVPVSTMFGVFDENGTEWQAMVEGVVPRIAEWTGRWVVDPYECAKRLGEPKGQLRYLQLHRLISPRPSLNSPSSGTKE